MKPTTAYLEQRFDEFNRQMFAGRLPKIPVLLSNAQTFLGMCVFKKRRTWNGKTEFYDFRLRINTRFDLPEHQVEDVLIHEMIHYYIALNRLENTAHGPVFRQMMQNINQKFGRQISVSHKPTEMQQEEGTVSKRRYRVIAVVAFHDGRTGIKVLPRIMTSILKYYNNVLGNKDVMSIRLYMSDHIFFSRYPSSSALRVHLIEPENLYPYLEGAEAMECNGKEIVRR